MKFPAASENSSLRRWKWVGRPSDQETQEKELHPSKPSLGWMGLVFSQKPRASGSEVIRLSTIDTALIFSYAFPFCCCNAVAPDLHGFWLLKRKWHRTPGLARSVRIVLVGALVSAQLSETIIETNGVGDEGLKTTGGACSSQSILDCLTSHDETPQQKLIHSIHLQQPGFGRL